MLYISLRRQWSDSPMLGIGKRSPELLTSEALAKGVALGFIPVMGVPEARQLTPL